MKRHVLILNVVLLTCSVLVWIAVAQELPEVPEPKIVETKIETKGGWVLLEQKGYREIALQKSAVDSVAVYESEKPSIGILVGGRMFRFDTDTIEAAKAIRDAMVQ